MSKHSRYKYKARTLSGAQRRVQQLENNIDTLDALARLYKQERDLLARLAATGPAFDNPLVIAEAQKIRDSILRGMGMNPDGSFMA